MLDKNRVLAEKLALESMRHYYGNPEHAHFLLNVAIHIRHSWWHTRPCECCKSVKNSANYWLRKAGPYKWKTRRK